MYLMENIALAINGLKANKMRALLTMLGIIIGISSVIAIVTVGNAMTSSVTNMLNGMGANSIQLQITDKPDEHGNTNWNRPYEDEDMITDEMIEQYLMSFGDKVYAWAASTSLGTAQAINGRNQASGYVQGTNAGAIKIQDVDIVAGHFLNDREVDGAKNVVVLSDAFIKKLYPGRPVQEALGKEVKLRLNQGTYTFTVVGVYKYEISGFAATMSGDTSTNIFIPITVAKQIGDTKDGYYWLQIKASDQVTDSQKFAQQSEDYFNKRFYRSNKYIEIMAQSMDSMIGEMNGMMSTMSLAISVIAGISLLVGGIGVMNIMLVSVTERTREIGTRKALGARNSAIRVQFIVESVIICLIGGAIGVALGASLGYLASSALGFATMPTLSIVFVAVGFSMAIGVFFGYYPANKAAKLDPIEALRYE